VKEREERKTKDASSQTTSATQTPATQTANRSWSTANVFQNLAGLVPFVRRRGRALLGSAQGRIVRNIRRARPDQEINATNATRNVASGGEDVQHSVGLNDSPCSNRDPRQSSANHAGSGSGAPLSPSTQLIYEQNHYTSLKPVHTDKTEISEPGPLSPPSAQLISELHYYTSLNPVHTDETERTVSPPLSPPSAQLMFELNYYSGRNHPADVKSAGKSMKRKRASSRSSLDPNEVASGLGSNNPSPSIDSDENDEVLDEDDESPEIKRPRRSV
jgi:hypothetical protein